MANLTQSDFEELTDNLNAVREAIQDNDLAEAVSELGSAETEVRIFMTQVGAENSPPWRRRRIKSKSKTTFHDFSF